MGSIATVDLSVENVIRATADAPDFARCVHFVERNMKTFVVRSGERVVEEQRCHA